MQGNIFLGRATEYEFNFCCVAHLFCMIIFNRCVDLSVGVRPYCLKYKRISTLENMQRKNAIPPRIFITGLVTILIFGLLFWQYFHDGVPSHHILQQKDLPEISNWWGALLLPALACVLLGRIEKRLTKQNLLAQQAKNQTIKITGLFLLGLILGILIAVSFTNDYKIFLDNVLYVFLVLSLLFPIYYAEFILGFILGMTYTFGAVLPTIFILIIAALGFLIYRFIRPLILRVTKAAGK